MDVKSRFITALDALQERGTSLFVIAERTGIDRRNLIRFTKDPEHHRLNAEWCAALCEKFGVSPNYLMIARGGVFGREK